MKPSSAMFLASRISGHSALACALAGTGVIVVTVSAANAAERSRSRLVNMMLAPFWMLAFAMVLQLTFFAGGIFHDPSMIDGFFSLGQYSRIIRTKSPDGAGSQFDSLSLPGESFWM